MLSDSAEQRGGLRGIFSDSQGPATDKGGGGVILSRAVADDFFLAMIRAAQKHSKSSAASNSRLNYITVRRREVTALSLMLASRTAQQGTIVKKGSAFENEPETNPFIALQKLTTALV